MSTGPAVRLRLSLDGIWRFWPDADGLVPVERLDGPWVPPHERSTLLGPPRSIRVPGVWQAQFDDLRHVGGVAWYERDIDVPASWTGRRVRVVFGAVDYFATVWVNGSLAGTHEGGYLPFALDVGAWVRFGGRNSVSVRVLDPALGQSVGPFDFAEIPHGKQSWYGPLGGIWQSAALEATAEAYVERASIRADAASGVVRAGITLGSQLPAGHRLVAHVRRTDGTVVATGDCEPGAAAREAVVEMRVHDPNSWDPDTPILYALDVELLGDEGSIVDAISESFGFRDVSTRDGRILLNGRPIYLRGALDQDYHLPGLAIPVTNDAYRAQILEAKALGLNLLRCHIKVPDPTYLAWADRLGMLVWMELPSWGVLTGGAKRRARETLAGMIGRDGNHPAVIGWTIANESWGLDLSDAGQRRWLADTYVWAKQLDPTRVIVDNSACPGNFHVRSDLNDVHWYRAVPDQLDEWGMLLDGWVADPASTYSPHGDAVRSGREPMVVSEFGTWGLPDPAVLRDDGGREPWWFTTGERFSGGIVVASDVEDRFRRWNLGEVFGSWQRFIAESQEHQFEGLKLEIEHIRRRDAVAGYVVTELTDVQWECNGLLDMRRRRKAHGGRLASLNAADLVIGTPERVRLRSDETVSVDVVVAHGSAADLDGCVVTWSMPALGRSGELRAGSVPDGTATAIGALTCRVPGVERPTRARLLLALRDRRGREVSRNDLELLVFPSSDDGPREAARDVVVTKRWDDELGRRIADGARAVIVAEAADALPPSLALGLRPREGTIWKGDWAQGMGWLRPPLTEGLPLGPRVDVAFAGLTPRHVMTGYGQVHRDDVLAGQYLGWIHATAATIAGVRHGDGAALLCTFPLLEAGRGDPLAALLLRRLVSIAGAADFRPSRLAAGG